MNSTLLVLIRDPAVRNAITSGFRKAELHVTARAHAEGWSRLAIAPEVRGLIVCDDLEDAGPELLLSKIERLRPELPVAEVRLLAADALWVSFEDEEATLGTASELGEWLRERFAADAPLESASDGDASDTAQEPGFQAEILGDDGEVELVIRGRNARIREILGLVDTISATDSTVLFQGESGTGKDLFARLIHQKSRRRKGAFIAVNCGAMPDTLIESELFGHEKGAFTGADTQKAGLLVAADGGTLFLDEIAEMSADTQVKLLRVLQSGWVRPVGATRSEKVDVRIIAATNRDLRSEVKAGTFRLDLYYRLNVINIQMPALRERVEDLPDLVDGIVARLSRDEAPPVQLGTSALEALGEYSWPGNIRELENIVERILLLHPDGEVCGEAVRRQLSDMELAPGHQDPTPEEATAGFAPMGAAYPVDWTLKEIEEVHIRRVLAEHKGNQTRAARSLGINVKTLYNKMRAAGMKREEFASG